MEFSGQLFSRTFVNAAVKTPILGRDFLEANDLVDNYHYRIRHLLGHQVR